MEKIFLFYLMLMLVYIGVNSRKDIPCDIPGICTLVYINQDLRDEVPLHFSISGYI